MSLPLVDDPVIANLVDDTGTGQDGSVVNRALFEDLATEIDSALIAPGSSQTPGQTTTEVIAARGNLGSLNSRISGVIDPDGNFTGASPIPLIQSYQPQNFVVNDDFMIWPDGDTATPADWAFTATGTSAIERCGPGLSDTQQINGEFCAKVTVASGTATLVQGCTTAGRMDPKARSIGFGVGVKASAGSVARMYIASGANVLVTPYVTLLNEVTWISAVGVLASNPGPIFVALQMLGPGTFHWGGVTAIFSEVAPDDWIPCPTELHELRLQLNGALNSRNKATFNESCRVESVMLYSSNTGIAAASPLEVNVFQIPNGGGAAVSMLATTLKPVQGDGLNNYEYRVPDGALYRYRCFRGIEESAERIYVLTQVADAGEAPVVDIRCLRYRRLLGRFLY